MCHAYARLIMREKKRQAGFALPTIIIASIVMFMVMLGAVQAASSVGVGLQTQYYNKLASEAAESGVAYANACLSASGGTVEWTNASPLHPNTDCKGTVVSGRSAYVAQSNGIRTTFSIGLPKVNTANQATVVTGSGTAELLRTSVGTVWRSYTQSALTSDVKPYVDDALPVASSIEGYWSTPPDGYLLEDGSAVSRAAYPALFAAIGTTYGAGDGSTTFNLPDSRGRATVNLNAADAEFKTVGEKYGEKTHKLTIAEMPSHSHPQNVTANSGGSGVRDDYKADGSGLAYSQGINTGLTGGDQPHNNIQPSITKVFAIKYAQPTTSASVLPAGSTDEGYWSTPPTGYLVEDGSAVSRTTYADLFAAIGTTYGAGDGSTTFNLPDSRGRVAVNINPADAEFKTMGEKYGEKTHTLTIAEMPSHTHTEYTTSGTGGPAVRNDYSSDNTGLAYPQGINTTATGGNQPHNNIQPSITKLATIKYTAATTPPTGVNLGVAPATSIYGYWNTVPSGYLAEDGSAVSRSTYSALFAVIGTSFGAGDGSTTFNLPDSRGRISVNLNPADAEFKTIGEKYGEKTHKLTIAEMPSHSHGQNVTANSGGPGLRLDYAADGTGNVFVQGAQTAPVGGDQPHNNIQPSITALFAIKY